MANTTYNNFGHFYCKHTMPVLLDCQFTVAAADTGGLGITGLKGPGIQAVYMHTSQTPAALNPNPASGICLVQLKDNYYADYLGFMGQVTALSGSSILVASAGTVASTTYVITIVGTTTTAGWQSLGLPVGITPAVGVSFVATATTTATGTGAVQVPHANGTGIQSIEQIGTPGLTLSPTGIGAGYPYMMFRFMGPTNSSTTTPIAVAPRDGSIISLKMYLSNSSVVVAGE